MLVLLGAGIVVVFAWIVVTGLLARGALAQVRGEVPALRAQLTAGDVTAARHTADEIADHAAHAHTLTTGPIWAGAAGVPGADPIRSLRAITTQVDGFAHGALPDLLSATARLDPATLRLPDGRIDLARISAAAPALDRALAGVGTTRHAIATLPAHTWIGSVDTARRDLLDELATVQHAVQSADIAAHVVPPMLGAAGTRRYFVAFQNEAEARGTGGVPGAFAILRADGGRLTFERFGTDSQLYVTPVRMAFGTDYDALFRGTRSTDLYVNANLSPHFPYAAQTWAAMWAKRTGEHLDGAIAVDPTLLSYLLDATGPARLADGTVVSASNVVALTQSTVYARFPQPQQSATRKEYLLDIARAVSQRLLSTRADAKGLLAAGAEAAGERRLLIYSADSKIENQLARTTLAGVVPDNSSPYAGLSVVNDGGNKLDYYLERGLSWASSGCGSQRDVTVTIRLRNNAPASGLSPYVTSRTDDHTYAVRPGDNREEISYYATRGAVLQSVRTNGRQDSAEAGVDRGHPVFRLEVEVPRGTTTTVVLHLTEPGGTTPPTVLRQPLIHPLSVRVEGAHCA